MKKTTLSLLAAAAMATAGLASAQTHVEMGATEQARVMGAPATVMVPMESYTAVQPGWRGTYEERHRAAGTFNVPARAGEFSTMTNGQPNMLTDNNRIAGDTHVQVYSTPNF